MIILQSYYPNVNQLLGVPKISADNNFIAVLNTLKEQNITPHTKAMCFDTPRVNTSTVCKVIQYKSIKIDQHYFLIPLEFITNYISVKINNLFLTFRVNPILYLSVMIL